MIIPACTPVRLTRLPRNCLRIFRSKQSILAMVFFLITLSLISTVVVNLSVNHLAPLDELKRELYNQSHGEVKQGWQLINTTHATERTLEYVERSTLTQTFLTPECTETWVASGLLCDDAAKRQFAPDLQESLKLSTVHTWVNGSDIQLSSWKSTLFDEQPTVMVKNRQRYPVGGKIRHFRTHDELMYSIRSVLRSLPSESIANMHLITTDLPVDEGKRVGQIPNWLNLDALCAPSITIHHHWHLFKSRGREHSEQQARIWKENVLPTFNSIGIETQLTTLAPSLTDTFIYLNDDFFLTRNLTRSDFSSPLFGPIFRMHRHLLVTSTAKGTSRADPEGEWPSLGYANWLLDQRFGARKRPYLQHFAKAFSAPLLEEIASIWGEELTQSAEIRFRGAGYGKALSLTFLAVHFTIERHREALLWSFIVARSDRDHSGTLSPTERNIMIAEIGYKLDQTTDTRHIVPHPQRRPHQAFNSALEKAGLTPSLATNYTFISSEGAYAYVWLNGRPRLTKSGKYVLYDSNTRNTPPSDRWPRYSENNFGDVKDVACTMDILDCFGSEFLHGDGTLPIEDTFKRVAFDKPRCGDCIIISLLRSSGEAGFSAFLPDSPHEDSWSGITALSMSKGWKEARYDTLGGRARAVSLVQRYSYVIGDTESYFLPLHVTPKLPKQFKDLAETAYTTSGPAFVTVNDELPDRLTESQLRDIDDPMRAWMETQWPQTMCWET